MRLRASTFAIVSALILVTLAGCGGSGGGNTTPVGPLPAMVTSLSPSSVVAGASTLTLTVKGTGFVSGDIVEFGSFALNSTFVSSTEMQAQVPASDFAAPDTPDVYIATSPPSSLNYGMTFTIQDPQLTGNISITESVVNVQANDMVWDPVSQLIYLSLPGSTSTANGAIAALNPVTGLLASRKPPASDLIGSRSPATPPIFGPASMARANCRGSRCPISRPISAFFWVHTICTSHTP